MMTKEDGDILGLFYDSIVNPCIKSMQFKERNEDDGDGGQRACS